MHTKLENCMTLLRKKDGAGVLFHQDRPPAHKAAVAMAAIQEIGFELLEAHSPDLAARLLSLS